ncbi:hypothetical protein CcrC1_gp124 [Caulobacter phage C1]|nr:hypothetical protein CcrC1_gp124 [Caulobacter phage C1]UTU08353.1 hypothetical protein CcrC2_gp125 [Caulobacter phage C2]UTU08870.1 hypothetical protein CcrJ4_gp119 [Caulobacter phage J4]UTU09425.1 hypothetical protein CcrBL47_gp139 [Caulobacter phage BL47]UTU09986.1 hypothetical protein CcrRB23_gp124 [Caulobacter phage RB23]WGN97011.1 hypothetical protein [Bertelyvirus sp.]
MTITIDQKVDFLWKRLIYGVTKTATADDKAGSNESIPSPIIVSANDVWSDVDLITASPPVADTAVIKLWTGLTRLRASSDPTAQPNFTWIATSTFGDLASRKGEFIPPGFGSGYAVKVYIGDPATGPAARIFPDTTGEEWVFDYAAGVLNFAGAVPANKTATIGSGTVSVASNGIYFEAYQYIGEKGGGGGVEPEDLGTMAYQDSDDVNITGGTIANATFINVTIDGGTF